MARPRFQPGEMRSRIVIARLVHGTDSEGYPARDWMPLFDGEAIPCRWTNAHGAEVWRQAQLDVKESATVLMRYTPAVDIRCRIWKAGDDQTEQNAWEIIGLDNVQERGELLELKVKRVVPG